MHYTAPISKMLARSSDIERVITQSNKAWQYDTVRSGQCQPRSHANKMVWISTDGQAVDNIKLHLEVRRAVMMQMTAPLSKLTL